MSTRRARGAIPALAAVAATAVLAAGCGEGSEPATPQGSPGSPAAEGASGPAENKTRPCAAFTNSDPAAEQELTYTGDGARVGDDGVMGKLTNKTSGTIWVIPVGYSKGWAKRECTLAADQSVYFSKTYQYAFQFRPEAKEPDDLECEFATCIRIVDPTVGYTEFTGAVNQSVFSKPQYTVKQKQGEENSFVRGDSKVTVKREKDGHYNSDFPSEYKKKGMSDWPHFTVKVEGLINF